MNYSRSSLHLQPTTTTHYATSVWPELRQSHAPGPICGHVSNVQAIRSSGQWYRHVAVTFVAAQEDAQVMQMMHLLTDCPGTSCWCQ